MYDINYNLKPSSVIKPFEVKDNHLFEIEKAVTGFMLLNKAALERIKNDVDYFFLPLE